MKPPPEIRLLKIRLQAEVLCFVMDLEEFDSKPLRTALAAEDIETICAEMNRFHEYMTKRTLERMDDQGPKQ